MLKRKQKVLDTPKTANFSRHAQNAPPLFLIRSLSHTFPHSEMTMSTNLLRLRKAEWALLKRHPSETLFGIQIAGGYVNSVTRSIEAIDKCGLSYDFIDLNLGCPLDEICIGKRSGAGLMNRPYHLRCISRSIVGMTNKPVTVKMRKGFWHEYPNAKQIVQVLERDGISAVGVLSLSLSLSLLIL